MPRVNGVMQPLPNVYGTPGRPIESAKYNTQLDDIISDLNAARPVTAGGTGATDGQGARDNLGVTAALNGKHGYTPSSITDANALVVSGIYMTGATFTGSPFAGTNGSNQGYIEHSNWLGGNTGSGYSMQTHTQINGGGRRRIRIKDNNVWQPWREQIERGDMTPAGVSLGNVANKSEAQMVASGAIATALGGKAATSHTHLTSDISDSGSTGRALITAASAQAARGTIGVFMPATFASSRGSQPVGNTKEPLAFVDFVATAPNMIACSYAAMTAGGQIYTYLSHTFTNLANNGVFYTGPELPTLLTGANDFKTESVIDVFTGLGVGVPYRAQIFGRTNDGFATSTSSFIRVMNA